MPPEWVGVGICGRGFFKVDAMNVLRFMSCVLTVLPILISQKFALKRPLVRHTVRLSLVPCCPRHVFKIKMTKLFSLPIVLGVVPLLDIGGMLFGIAT